MNRRALMLAGAVTLALRLTFVLALPDFETDSYGHMNIARALAGDPSNVMAHWVWLPAWHFALAALVALGGTHRLARAIVAVAQTVAPFVLYDVTVRTTPGDPSRARRVASLAAIAYTVAPLPNVLATSSQPETAFSLLVLFTVWALSKDRYWLAGALLAGASLMRYEAWGGVALLGLLAGAGRLPRRALVAAAIPAVAVAIWLVARRATYGVWLDFMPSTRAFVAQYHVGTGRPAWVDMVAFPLLLPFAAWGPAAPLAVVGARRAWRPSFVVPTGILAFLVASYALGGAIAMPRYLTALTPFGLVAMIEGALALPVAKQPRVFLAVIASLALMTVGAYLYGAQFAPIHEKLYGS